MLNCRDAMHCVSTYNDIGVMMSRKKGGLVYTTSSEELCPYCENSINNCICDIIGTGKGETRLKGGPHQEMIKIRRETKGRAGKTVTTIHGIPRNLQKEIAAKLKQYCGTGGSAKDGIIVIQGDQRSKIKSFLENQGYLVKLAGG